ncbi:hypothetical protein BESB_013360 [Besnoitia besnoiti]|uniref:Intraflagellar transport 57-like protein n=1 Tax=Besnoitia besnoiti TaxID=94643 RepID=A0A2A9M6B0_BESBE|nr:hypothetical protein BESB_013360 [Besnoitia besnoiti]PFH32724.1 hypothetical protein BESB_013360 [Besnoitia besnoiti]
MSAIGLGGPIKRSTGGSAATVAEPCARPDVDAVGHSEQIYNLVSLIKCHDASLLECGGVEGLTRHIFCHPWGDGSPQVKLYQSWVIHILRLLGKKVEISRSDDPLAVAEIIVDALQGLDLDGAEVSAAHMRQGYGYVACKVLHELLKKLITARGIRLTAYELCNKEGCGFGGACEEDVEDFAATQIGGGGAELSSDHDNEEDDDVSAVGELGKRDGRHDASAASGNSPVTVKDQWTEEVEQMLKFKKAFDQHLPQLSRSFKHLQAELQEMLTRVEAKEEWIGRQFSRIITEHKEICQELENQVERQQMLRGRLEDLQSKREATQEAYDQTSKLLQDKYDHATDTRPLQELAKTLATMKAEIKQMELRIGVLQHTSIRAAIWQAHFLVLFEWAACVRL